MTARPKRGDTEDDLLEFQAQFLASRNTPSATVVRSNKDENHGTESKTSDKRKEAIFQRDVVDLHGLPQSLPSSFGDSGPPKKKSKFKTKRLTKENKTDTFDDEDAEELLDRHDQHISSVLTEIRERDIQRSQVSLPANVVHKGFPEALHRGAITAENKNPNNQSKKSLFAQHFQASNPSAFGLQLNPQDLLPTLSNPASTMDINNQPAQQRLLGSSRIVSGEGLVTSSSGNPDLASREIEQIHQENLERLSAMNEKEILQEQERLRKSLDPSILNFLKNRHKDSQKTETSGQEDRMESEETQQFLPSNSEPEVMFDLNEKLKQTLHDNESMDINMDGKIEDSIIKATGEHMSFSDNMKDTNSEDTVTEKIPEVEELTQMAAKQNWVHMDAIEPEKLAWMKDCSKPTAIAKESGQQARFAFDGTLVTRDANIPVNAGLHHHGNEPEAAGYTLEELFMLTRSSFLQQRVVAIQTLARIVAQDTLGTFTDVLKTSVLSSLLDAGIIFLLRWALDDTADAVIAVTIQCLSSILVVPSDQECTDNAWECYRGQEQPSLQPEAEEKTQDGNNDEDETGKHETDSEIVKKDVVKGLLQMRILPRLRYILEVCRPSPTAVRGIFAILTRIAQHSTAAAHEITKCPRMLESVFSKFLPVTWRKVDMALEDTPDIYMLPSPEALRLIRHISNGGRHLTSILISKFHLMDVVLCYTCLHPKHTQLSYKDAMDLCIESFRVWTVCICYGLACNEFRENFSTSLQHIQKFNQDLSVKDNTTIETILESHRACAVMKMLEQVIHVAGTSAEFHAKMTASSPDHLKESEADCFPPAPVNWSHVMGFMPLIVSALTKFKTEILSVEESSLDSILDCHILRFTSMCNLLAAFYSKLQSQPCFSPVESLQDIEDLVSKILVPIIDSAFMGSMIKYLGSPVPFLLTRGISSLPDYGTLPHHSQRSASTEAIPHQTAVAFMPSFNHLLCSVIKVHKGIASKFLAFVTREDIMEYVTQMTTRKEVFCQSFFARFENHFQYFTIKLFYMVAMSVDLKDVVPALSTYHTAALVVFSRLQAGDEYYAHDLMSTVLFNSDFYPEASDHANSVAKELSEMTIGSQGMASTPQILTKDSRTYTQKELLCQAHKNLLAIRSTYMGSFSKVRHALAASRSLALHQPHDVQSLLLPPSTGPFLPADWMFVPIIDLHNQTISSEMKGHGVDEVPPAMISVVTCTLQMILILEEWRPVSLSTVSMVAKITRLMCIFLTGSDLFLDGMVHSYMRSLLTIYTRPSCLARIDFSGSVAGLSSFYDLYTSLLSHYSAVSFGDPLFASFLVLPLAQRHHIKFRHALWDEYIGTIRAVSFPVNQVPIPLHHYLYPTEQDEVLVYLYLRALSSQETRPQWCPFFYLIAVHHVNAFIYQRINPKDTMLLTRKLALLNHVMQVKTQDVKNDLLYYYKPLPDSSSDKAFEVFTSLPPDREILLRNRKDFEECQKLYETMSSAQ